MIIDVLHNISRDASFGLNMILDSAGKFREARSHELVRVFEFDGSDLIDPSVELFPEMLADICFRVFNIGHETGNPDAREHDLAVRYRNRRLRSLSVGDVLAIDGKFYACASCGWDEVEEEDLRVLGPRAAIAAIRQRYRFGPREELSGTVPLEG